MTPCSRARARVPARRAARRGVRRRMAPRRTRDKLDASRPPQQSANVMNSWTRGQEQGMSGMSTGPFSSSSTPRRSAEMADSVIAFLLLVGGCVAAEAAAVSLDASTPQPQPQSTPKVPELPWEPEPEASGCVYRNRTYAVGQRWVTGPPDKCAKFLCEDNDQIAALTCPWFLHPPHCTIVPGDKSATYPHCCPKRSCPSPAPMARATAFSPEASSMPVTVGSDHGETSVIPEGVTATTTAATTIAITSTEAELGVTDLATASPTASATTPLQIEEEVLAGE